MNNGPFDLDQVRTILNPDCGMTTKAVSDNFYAELDQEFQNFSGHTLISRFAFAEPWPTWEMHPEGDELVYLLSGDTDFLLRNADGEQRVRVSQPGHYVIVPQGCWHTAQPHEPTSMLFITPGEGTENRAEPPL